jgi:hypothetical protein
MKIVLGLGLALIVGTGVSCGPNQRIIESSQENTAATSQSVEANSTPTVRTFDQDLTAMRTADFNFVYVFRRRDGGVFNPDDKAFISSTTPPEMNRKTLSDGGKAVIVGSNFRMPADILNVFKSRFVIEDHSKPESQPANSNR